MHERFGAAALAAVVLAGFLAIPTLALASGTDEDYELAVSTILCDCGCHPQSVKACACGRAAEMREEIRAQVVGADGAGPMSGDEVVASYVARFGESIRISPTATGFNLVAWLGPPIGLVLASFCMLLVLRRWRSQSPSGMDQALAQEADVGVAAADHDEYLNRLRRQVEDLE